MEPNTRTLEEELRWAEKWACKGEVYFALDAIKTAKSCATTAGITIPPETIQSIEKTAYSKGYEISLDFARRFALEGDVTAALKTNEAIRTYADKAGITISEGTLELIENTAYRNGVGVRLNQAIRFAIERRDTAIANLCLDEAKEYALKVGLNITDKIQEIKNYFPK